MNINKLTSIIVFSFIGFSFASANEDSISTIKNSNVENIRGLGYELCKLYTKHDHKSYLESLRDYVLGIQLEEKLARKLMKDHDLQEEIFSGKKSADPIINELKEGCFDFLDEELFLHAKDFLEIYSNASDVFNDLICLSEEHMENLHNQIEKIQNASAFPYKLMTLLGLTDRIMELQQKAEDLQIQYGLIEDVDDDDEIEL